MMVTSEHNISSVDIVSPMLIVVVLFFLLRFDARLHHRISNAAGNIVADLAPDHYSQTNPLDLMDVFKTSAKRTMRNIGRKIRSCRFNASWEIFWKANRAISADSPTQPDYPGFGVYGSAGNSFGQSQTVSESDSDFFVGEKDFNHFYCHQYRQAVFDTVKALVFIHKRGFATNPA